jgi:hypothetical protein
MKILETVSQRMEEALLKRGKALPTLGEVKVAEDLKEEDSHVVQD